LTIRDTGHVPSPVVDCQRAAVLAGNAREKVAAGRQMAGLQRMAPDVAAELMARTPRDERFRLVDLMGVAELPLAPETIVEIWDERRNPLPPEEIGPYVPDKMEAGAQPMAGIVPSKSALRGCVRDRTGGSGGHRLIRVSRPRRHFAPR